MNKEECLQLGISYVKTYNKYPSARKWTIKSAGCSRDRIYEIWGSWIPFVNELKKLIKIQPSQIKYVPLYEQEVTITEENSLEYWVLKYFSSYEDSLHKTIIISSILDNVSVTKAISTSCNIGMSATMAVLTKYFPEKEKGTAYKKHILSKYGKKQCCNCHLVFDYTFFSSNISNHDKKHNNCPYCDSRHIHSIKNHYRLLAANRRILYTNKLSALYAKEIKEIYNNCPAGYHVDHIIPINGKYICGLHVPSNLQYLPTADNIRKSNHFTNDWVDTN